MDLSLSPETLVGGRVEFEQSPSGLQINAR